MVELSFFSGVVVVYNPPQPQQRLRCGGSNDNKHFYRLNTILCISVNILWYKGYLCGTYSLRWAYERNIGEPQVLFPRLHKRKKVTILASLD